jgi:hypothetical protein
MPGRIVARRGLHQVGDCLPGLRAQLEDGAELRAANAGIAHQGQQLHLFLQQPGLFVVVVEEERGRYAERLGQRLDQALLRILRLAVTELPDRRIADFLPGNALDQGGYLVVGEGPAWLRRPAPSTGHTHPAARPPRRRSD